MTRTTELYSVNPRTGARGASCRTSTVDEVMSATVAARSAYLDPRLEEPALRSALLRAAAARLGDVADDLLAVCEAETGLPSQRLHGELGRTTQQLKAFADMVDEGSFVRAIIDEASDSTVPPRPDLRRMLIPLGPVAVFGASNFPLAFGVAGGDTASALAAGCPVVVKGHPSQPATNSLVGEQLARAVGDVGAPAGTFANVQAEDLAVGEAMVEAPAIRAVAFTGSFAAAQALCERARKRATPIPVFAEMGGVNPVVITPRALEARGDEICEALCNAVSFAAGQLCTKPGIVFVPTGRRGDALIADAARRLADEPPAVMLNARLRARLQQHVEELGGMEGVQLLTDRIGSVEPGVRFTPMAFRVSAAAVTRNRALLDERFGPVVIFLAYESEAQLVGALEAIEGDLTATIHTEEADHAQLGGLVKMLRERVGRLIFNGVPTGVAVTHAMQHGGPYPATTAPETTSVGMMAIERFLRPVAYQSASAALLPPALQDANPLGLWRRVNGSLTRDAVGRPA